MEMRSQKRTSSQSGGGPPHSKTLSRGWEHTDSPQRLGVRQCSGALDELEVGKGKRISTHRLACSHCESLPKVFSKRRTSSTGICDRNTVQPRNLIGCKMRRLLFVR